MVRTVSQYVALTFLLAVLGVEIAGVSFGSPALELAYDYLLAIVFSLFTIAMIAMCGWIVFLWDIDRLFFRLEGRIDAQINAESASDEPDASLVGRAREMLESKVQDVRARAVYVIEKSYWDDVNSNCHQDRSRSHRTSARVSGTSPACFSRSRNAAGTLYNGSM
jgi:hypothetical protein